jgi:uncharacterized HAD superfamily protein
MTSIYIDMDDVLAESNKTFLHILERELGKKAEYSQITTFDLQKSFDLSDDEYAHFFYCIHNPDEMILHAPVAGARETLKLWHDNGYQISILTGRPLDTREVSLKWLKLHGFAHDSFSIVNKYGRDASRGDMSMTLESLSKHSFDLAVEDSGQMARFLSETMDTRVALLDRPWNRSMSFNGNVQRCADWKEIKQKFKRL